MRKSRVAGWGRFLVSLIWLVSGSAPDAEGREWFVAPGGAGSGTRTAPFGRVQDGLNAALPGDVVVVQPGIYREAIRSVRAGAAGAPITLRGERGTEPVVVTTRGTLLRVDHPHFVVDGLVFDAEYADADALDINDGGDFFVLRSSEVRRAGRDGIDMGAPEGVLIEHCLIHHLLNPARGRSDAHGIVAGAARDLTVRDTEIHTFSGDGIQLDPGRALPGWNRLTIERCRIWLAPLERSENGFPAGVAPGENAVDTKTIDLGPRASLLVRDTLAWGFRGGFESNMAAFNLKENVDAVIDGVTVWDSEIAFRLRGPSAGRPGAWVLVQNSLVRDVGTAVRYEDEIQNLRVWNNTFGQNIARPFQAGSASGRGVDVRNLLLLAARLPAEAFDRSNLAVDERAFVDPAGGDYHLSARSPAIDAGRALDVVRTDRDGVSRPQGKTYDVGAYEWRPSSITEMIPRRAARDRQSAPKRLFAKGLTKGRGTAN